MGQHDYYPFVMSRPVLRKMHFIQMVSRKRGAGRRCWNIDSKNYE